MLWTPYDTNRAAWSGYLDGSIWPYHGTNECTVSLTPALPIYRRIIIREEAAASLGCQSTSFRLSADQAGLTKLTYTLELELLAEANGTPKGNRLKSKAPTFSSMWRHVLALLRRQQPPERHINKLPRGALLDENVVADSGPRSVPLGQQLTDAQIDKHARALMAIVQAAADENGRLPTLPWYEPTQDGNMKLWSDNSSPIVSRLHNAVAWNQIPFLAAPTTKMNSAWPEATSPGPSPKAFAGSRSCRSYTSASR